VKSHINITFVSGEKLGSSKTMNDTDLLVFTVKTLLFNE